MATEGLGSAVIGCGFFCLLAHALLNDITTDINNPPGYASVLVGDLPAKSRMLIPKAYPDLMPATYPDKKYLEVFAAVAAVAGTMPRWEVTLVDPAKGAIEAVASTPTGFKDDVVIRVQNLTGGGSVVDMRSKSRVGVGDLGANAARIRAYFKVLHEMLGNET